MPIIVKREKIEYTPAPEGLHQAVCCDVVDLGLLPTPWGPKHKIELRWQLEITNPDHEDKPFMVTKRFTSSLHEKANLRSTLETWRGKKFSDEELDGFDIEALLGVNCQVQIIHNITDDATYANVQAVVPAPRNAAKLRVRDYVRKVDRQEDEPQYRKDAAKPKGPWSKEQQATDEDIPF
jgi:hypothetical protein